MGNKSSSNNQNGTSANGGEGASLKGSSSNLTGFSGSSTALNKPKINAPSDKGQKKTNKGAGSARSSMSSEGRGKPVLPLNHRQIIKYCMDNSKDDLGERIYRRVIDKRDDFRAFVETLPKIKRTEMSEGLRDFLVKVVENLTDNEEVQRLSEEFGEKHVQFRSSGFRPDFFAVTADAMTTECVFLDAAVHQATETLTAWSQLTATMFSSVRDGFYAEMRRLRRASNCMNNKSKGSVDFSTDGSTKEGEEPNSRRSNSPSGDGNGDESSETPSARAGTGGTNVANPLMPSESGNYLCPPQVY